MQRSQLAQRLWALQAAALVRVRQSVFIMSWDAWNFGCWPNAAQPAKRSKFVERRRWRIWQPAHGLQCSWSLNYWSDLMLSGHRFLDFYRGIQQAIIHWTWPRKLDRDLMSLLLNIHGTSNDIILMTGLYNRSYGKDGRCWKSTKII